MAVMTPTEVRNGNISFGDMRGKFVDFAIGIYATGGLAVSPKSFGMNFLQGVSVEGGNAAAAAYRFLYDTINKKLIVQGGLGAEERVYAESDIKGSANTDVGIASGTLPTNGGLISNLANAANTTAFTIALQPDISRNVSISFKNTNVGASTGNATNVVIVGTFRGAAQTETISFTALELTSTAQNEVATKYGSQPFDTITSITPSAAQPANWQHAAGPGSKLGLAQAVNPNVEASILKLTKNAADLAVTGLFSATNQTVNFGTLSDGDDISVTYLTGGEVTGTTDLSAVTVRLLGKGF